MYVVDYSLMFSSSYILSFKLLRQLDIQHHGLYQFQILLAEPWKIDTSEIDMALLQQIENPCSWNHFSRQKKKTGLLMSHVVEGILSIVSLSQERYHHHIVLYHCIVSYQIFVPAVCSFFPKTALHILSIDIVS